MSIVLLTFALCGIAFILIVAGAVEVKTRSECEQYAKSSNVETVAIGKICYVKTTKGLVTTTQYQYSLKD